MAAASENPQNWRFGAFEVEGRTAELRRNGVAIRLQEQPSQLLLYLLQHAGEIVTREDLRAQLWPADTFVDFDHALNTAVMKLREALGDSSEKPLYIQTLPRKGYRFVAPVTVLPPNGASASTVQPVNSQPVRIQPSLSRIQADAGQPVETPPPTRSGAWGRRQYFRLALFGAVILALAGLGLWITMTRPLRTPRVVRFTQLTSDGQRKIGPLVSDGVRVYFNEWLPDGRLILAQTSVKGGEVTPLSVPLNAPFIQDISKDGTELLVANEEGIQGRSIWLQPVAGGSPHRIGTVLTSWGPWGPGLAFAAFSPDETHIIYSQGNDIYSVARDGSALRKILTAGHLTKDFQYSPDAKVLRFTQFDPFEEQRIMSASANWTGLHELVDGCCGKWTPDGRYFIFEGQPNFRSNLWALPQKGKFGRQSRNDVPIQLTAGPLDFQLPSPARSGNEIFAIGTSHRAEFVRYDKHRGEFVPYLSGISAADLAFSADGQWVAYTSFPDGDLWRSRVDGSEKMQLTSSPIKAAAPSWSPDGRQIAFIGILPGGAWNVHIILSAGSSAERLMPSDRVQLDVGWSPDGKSLIFGTALDPKAGIYVIDLNSRQVSTLPGSKGLFSPHWSPDGRYISGTIIKSDQLMLFDTATQSWKKPCDCVVSYPNWSHDGRYLYFHDKDNRIARLRLADYKVETVVEVSSAVRWTALNVLQWFGLTPDDSPVLPRNIGTQEIYALQMDWR
jgi:DNA-binding winged helix-turn-helix (wHTH) protein/Tol biopolymer transport system component